MVCDDRNNMDSTTRRARAALRSIGEARLERTDDSSRHHDQVRLARRSAQVLMFGAGFLTIINAASPLHEVNTGALRVTGAVTVLASALLAALPWHKHARVVSYAVVTVAISALVVSDSWHHYSRNDAAIAVYPIFFVLVIAWA